jgi:hypothetical protein
MQKIKIFNVKCIFKDPNLQQSHQLKLLKIENTSLINFAFDDALIFF